MKLNWAYGEHIMKARGTTLKYVYQSRYSTTVIPAKILYDNMRKDELKYINPEKIGKIKKEWSRQDFYMDPLIVFVDQYGDYRIHDGRHRLVAAYNGFEEEYAVVILIRRYK